MAHAAATALASPAKDFLSESHTSDFPKYPKITARLTDGNVFAVIGDVATALRRGGVPLAECRQFEALCLSQANYTDVLVVCFRTCKCDKRG